jgi:prepilin-type N-terminal cleavage/methylation domain-containing protein
MKTRTTRLNTRASGFTLIELLLVVVIAAVLMGYAVPQLNRARAKQGARNARDAFAWTAQRARVRAVQTGKTQLLHINPTTDRAWIVAKNDATDILVTVNFQTEHEATMRTTANALISVCYGPRGYAFKWATYDGTNWNCDQAATDNVDIWFSHDRVESRAILKAAGQVQRP